MFDLDGVKPLVSVGGWTGSVYFSSLVASDTSRNYFAGNITSFINQYGFAGVDLDWEYPNNVGNGNRVNDADADNYLSFLATLRKSLGVTPLITAAVSMGGFLGPNQAPVQNLKPYADYFDYINIMNYDVSGSWLPTTGPNSPLVTCGSSTSMTDALAYWTLRGFPASQIVL